MGTAAAPVAALAGIAEVTPEPSKSAPAPIDYQIPLFTGREEAFLFPKESLPQLDFNSPEIQELFDVKGLHEHASYASAFPIEERIREAMAYEMHIAVDVLAETYNYAPLIDSIPAPLTGLYGILQQQYFNETGETHLATKLYDTGVEYCHKAIDFVFSTDQANAFSPEEKAKNSWNYSDLSLLISPKGILKVAHFLEKGSKNFFIKVKEAIQPFTKSNLRLGQQMHNSYRAGEIILNKKTKEFILPSRRRIDFLDIENGKVYELKPNNPRAILEGKKQLARYIEELKTIPKLKDIEWERILETYEFHKNMENKEFKKIFNETTKSYGYESSFGGWFKESDECIAALFLQKSNFGNYYYLNIKIFIQGILGETYKKSKELKYAISDIFGRQPEEYTDTFNLEYLMDGGLRKEKLEKLFHDFVDPLVHSMLTREDIIKCVHTDNLFLPPAVKKELGL